jgi:hypothetical protein
MAAGDITLTTPKVITTNTLQFVQAVVTPSSIDVFLKESVTGAMHSVHIDNASCVGVDYAGGVFTDGVARAIAGEFTRLLGLVFKASPLTVLMSTLQGDGVITVAGSVG